jgi:ubiquinone/menaquinone biosynthesis C-methylase UbiE
MERATTGPHKPETVRPDEQSADRIHDAIADRYTFGTDSSPAARMKVELLRARVRTQDAVLDVGAANGLHMSRVAPLAARVTGVDINERMLEQARERLAGVPNADLVRASATALPFEDGQFDIAYSFSTLLLVPGVDDALDEIARVTRPGGLVLLDLTGRWNLSQVRWRRWYRSQGHFGLNAFTWPQLTSGLGRRGLTVEESHAFGFADQWQYLRGARRLGALERFVHSGGERDIDYHVSNVPGIRRLANRWLVVARRSA